MKHCFAMLAAAGALAFHLPGCPLGPDTPGEIFGRVTDASGAVVSGARITAVDNATNDGFSWYHSLQTSLRKRFARNYLLTATYTWSKYMEATSYLNDTDLAPTHVISSQDRPHRFVASFLYELPFARRNRWIGGWQAQGIYQWQSGAPLSFGDVLYYGGDIHSIALPADQRNTAHWFNTANFECDPSLQLVYNIRADAFNALNRTQFGAPGTSPTSSDFGSITSTSQLPRAVEFSLRLQF
jgi:hypothetical protein